MKTIAQYLVLAFILAGCASFKLEQGKVEFEPAGKYLDALPAEPSENEKNGVILRFSVPEEGRLCYREETRIYMQIEGDEGLGTSATRKISQKFRKVGVTENFIIATESRLLPEEDDVKSSEEVEMTPRGEIVRLFGNKIQTSSGSLEIESWRRDPIFPEEAVRIGGKWSYTEEMQTRLDSFWISRKTDKPDSIRADCVLEGFAVLNGRRCAVIRSDVRQARKDKIGTFISDMELSVRTYATERTYFDYFRGRILGKIIEAEIFSLSDDGKFCDHSRSRTILFPEIN